jgi:hypothetical protein
MPLIEKEYTANQTYTNYSRDDLTSVFGGEGDTFGADLTPEILKSPEFNIVFDADLANGRLRVDSVKVEVFYLMPAADPVILVPPWKDSYLQSGTIGRGADGINKFCVVGKNGLVKTSTNGTDWAEQQSNVVQHLRAVCSDLQGRFYAGGDDAVEIESSDGVAWARKTDLSEKTNSHLFNFNTDKEKNKILKSTHDGKIFENSSQANIVRFNPQA